MKASAPHPRRAHCLLPPPGPTTSVRRRERAFDVPLESNLKAHDANLLAVVVHFDFLSAVPPGPLVDWLSVNGRWMSGCASASTALVENAKHRRPAMPSTPSSN